MLRRVKVAVWVGAWMLALPFAGCMGAQENCDVTQGAGGQKVVCNGTVFSYTLQGGYSAQTDQYSWENRNERAYVSAVFQGGAGTVFVTIKDHNGMQVYSKSHAGSGQSVGSESTSAGEPGTWTIKVEVRDLSGQVVVAVHRERPS